MDIRFYFAPYIVFYRNSKSADKIPEDYLSQKFLQHCLERKGGFGHGWVKGYCELDPDSIKVIKLREPNLS